MKKRWICGLLATVLALSLVPGAPLEIQATEGEISAQSDTAMTVSDELIEVLKTMEGFAKRAYWDYAQYTVGYGTRCPDDMVDYYKNNDITVEEAEALLHKELASFETEVNNFAARKGLELEQCQFDALVSFSYNCGGGWMNSSGGYLYNSVVYGSSDSEFIYGMTLWSKAGSDYILQRRRLCEANMYLNGVYKAYNTSGGVPNNYRYVFLDGNGGTVRYAIHGFDTRDPIPAITYFTDIPTGVDEEGNPFVYKLAGWFTERTGGTEVTVLDGSLANGSVIYAQWRDPNTGEIVEIPVGDEVDAMELTVTSDSVQLWTGPGSYYSKGAVLAKNTTITVTQVYTVSSVTWGKCEQGWLNLANTNYSSILASQPKEFPLDGTVNGNEVRVRTGPGVSYGILYTVNKGTRVTIYEEHYDGTYNWGKMGEEENASWICVDYVTYDTKAEPTVTSVSMLELPTDLEYVQMQDILDLTGSVLVATYSDGSIKAMTVNDSMTSGYSHTKLGTNTVTVTYSGKSTTFDVNIVKATVTFRNYDGTVLSSAQYAYGDTVIQPEAPAKPADENGEYQFVGWDKTVTTCDGDAVYTAVFKPVYTVTFQNYDGTVLSSERYVLGDTVTEPAAPTRPADENGEYEFVGWDKQITACEGDTVYTAVYRQNILMATVTFLNYDGTVLSSGAYAFGDTVVEPEVPTRAADESGAYEFIGWDQEVTACEGDTVYTAVFWLVGDFDRNGTVNEDDAIYLLRHLIISPEDYPLLGTADYTADGTVNEDDAIYLLRHVIISPEDYPLVSTSNE